MATVVNLAKDTRASDLGRGVSSFLNRMRDRRIDGLQQELMSGIGSSKDEAEATALMGDPKFQEVVTDNNRLSAVVTHFNNAPLGKSSLVGYDKDGNQQILSISERDEPSEALRNAGLTLERSRIFYAVDPNNDFDIPELLGRHANAEEAKTALPASRLIENQIFMDQEEAASFATMRASTLSAQDRRANRLLAEDKFEFTQNAPNSPFAALQNDFDEGRIDEEFFEDAKKRLTYIWGRTTADVKLNYRKKLEPEGAAIASMSEQAIFMMQEVIKDQNIITGSAKIPAIFSTIGSEIATLAGGLGYTKRPIESGYYDASFEKSGLGGRSTAFKNMLTDFALMVAATSGQEGRSLSDKDFDRFLEIVGSDISDGRNFVTNMNQIMLSKQRQFSARFTSMMSEQGQAPVTWESTHGAFPVLFPGNSREETIKSWKEAHPQWDLDLPPE